MREHHGGRAGSAGQGTGEGSELALQAGPTVVSPMLTRWRGEHP